MKEVVVSTPGSAREVTCDSIEEFRKELQDLSKVENVQIFLSDNPYELRFSVIGHRVVPEDDSGMSDERWVISIPYRKLPSFMNGRGTQISDNQVDIMKALFEFIVKDVSRHLALVSGCLGIYTPKKRSLEDYISEEASKLQKEITAVSREILQGDDYARNKEIRDKLIKNLQSIQNKAQDMLTSLQVKKTLSSP